LGVRVLGELSAVLADVAGLLWLDREERHDRDDWVENMQFRVQGSGFRVQGSGFGVQGSGFRVQGSGFRVQGFERKGS